VSNESGFTAPSIENTPLENCLHTATEGTENCVLTSPTSYMLVSELSISGRFAYGNVCLCGHVCVRARV
jgi:hypothetical protein